jgi:hypothetical protein
MKGVIFTPILKEIRCKVDSAGSGYEPAADSFVRVNALGCYNCGKIS